MEKFVPFEKLSKKEQKKRNAEKRRDWGGISPVTRVAGDEKKHYTRKKKHHRSDEEW